MSRSGSGVRLGPVSSGRNERENRLKNWLLLSLVIPVGLGILTSLAWDPYPRSDSSFDRKNNGVWIGHKWYTGRNVRTGIPVEDEELAHLRHRLTRHGIRDLFVHVGPLQADGSVHDDAGSLFRELREALPDSRLLAWMGARLNRVPLAEADFAQGVVATARKLRSQGFDGIHFDLEPLHDGTTAYLDLLLKVRRALGDDFIISQATPRVGPFGLSIGPLRRSFWSSDFYRKTMELSDQTVVMAYESGIVFPKGYVAFVRHQTRLLSELTCTIPGHEFLIGIPSFEKLPPHSKREAENIRTASQGVRAGLESLESDRACLQGVSVYANWVTDDNEWRDYRRYWMLEGWGNAE